MADTIYLYILEVGLDLAVAIVFAVIGYLINKYLKDVALRNIVAEGVLFAQQIYKHLDGPERFEEAVKVILERLDNKGIKIDFDELRVMIEAAVKNQKGKFNEKWNNG